MQNQVPHTAHQQQIAAKDYRNIQLSGHSRGHFGDNHLHGFKDLLNDLPIARSALFNAYQRQNDPCCLLGTRMDILEKIYDWVDGYGKSCVFWLNGCPGTGKSVIARTVARKYHTKGRLAASFFFSRGSGDSSHGGWFVTSIARQLAGNKALDLSQFIRDSLEENHLILEQTLEDQWSKLVVQPLSRYEKDDASSTFLLVVDAMDECDEEGSAGILLRLLPQLGDLGNIAIRVLVTSRPEMPIRRGFDRMQSLAHEGTTLHHMSTEVVGRDIQLFLEYHLSIIAKEKFLATGWPGEQNLMTMVQRAQGLFIWAATACRYIQEGKKPEKRLNTLLEGSSGSTVIAPEEQLDKIYITVLRNSIPETYSEEEKEQAYDDLRLILGTVAVLFSSLSVNALSRLLDVQGQEVSATIVELHSVLDISASPDDPLRFHHDSFRGFLLNEARCKDRELRVNEQQAHKRLAMHCLRVMGSVLKENLCNQEKPGVPPSNRDYIQQCLPPEAQYACLYWISHFTKSGQRLRDNGDEHRFLRKHVLNWIEAIGWLGKTSNAIHSLRSLEKCIAAQDEGNQIYELLNDAIRFTLRNHHMIDEAPLQTYLSALLFAPSGSVLRQMFGHTLLKTFEEMPSISQHWGAQVSSLEGHIDAVNAVAISQDGKFIASGSSDQTIRLWNAESGARLCELKSCNGRVWAVAFSPDSKTLAASSSDDGTTSLCIWDVVTRTEIQNIRFEGYEAFAIAFSPDGSLIASGSCDSDSKVTLWDVASGKRVQTLKQQDYASVFMDFSPNGKTFTRSSLDQTLNTWDLATGNLIRRTNQYGVVKAIAFNHGEIAASVSDNGTVMLRDARTGDELRKLEDYACDVKAMAFSPDSKTLAVAHDEIVSFWDTSTGKKIRTLAGHSKTVNAIAFSANGKIVVSGSNDKTVRVWDIHELEEINHGGLDANEVTVVKFSPSGKIVATASHDLSIRLWDADSGEKLHELSPIVVWVINDVMFSSDSMRVLSLSLNFVTMWDVSTGKRLSHFECLDVDTRILALAPDYQVMALRSYTDKRKVRLWNISTGKEMSPLEGHLDDVTSVTFSSDGKTIASTSADMTVRLWETWTGTETQIPKGHEAAVSVATFSPDSRLLASASHDNTVRVWDVTARETIQLISTPKNISKIGFSHDGQALATDLGDIDLCSPALNNPRLRVEDSRKLELHGNWLRCNDEDLLWLPSEYRGMAYDVFGSSIAIGQHSGALVILSLRRK